MTLPEPIAAFFALPKHGDGRQLQTVFAEEAIVNDEGQDHVGLNAIKAWWQDVNNRTPFKANPQRFESKDGLCTVTAEVSGAFPGSPVTLDHQFRIRDGKVLELVIR